MLARITGMASWSSGSRMMTVGVFLSLILVYGFAYHLNNYEVYMEVETLKADPITIVQTKTVEQTVTHFSILASTKTESASPTSTLDPTKLAFMVETRSLPHLPLQLTHMTSVIPQEWTFKFMGSNTSINYLLSFHHLQDLVASKKLTLIPLPSQWNVSSRESISQMFTDPELYKSLSPAEHLLIFQPDSIFCTKAPTTLNDFIQYDYIGAPWSAKSTHGGNGGLSLRRVSSILRVLENERRKPGDGALEDLWLSNALNRLEGSKMANAEVSKTFSVESVWDDAPLGYHIGWLGVHHEQIWDKPNYVSHIMNYCPEVKIILGMKIDNDKPQGVS
ncbi:hypothetical protein SS1G_13279 [Sclerotinia sclerotiorum 1980 UF-70]|uniref:DUF5672 domain-containing protein n=2 Tax=Sclerotinia sclerotiorum (strain ATCC 18683 / 1980 / Ss-1) TaxID=665079 RepID=A0A1D9Q0G4_SCLS1|nr:hypothetical protein SS1G_13279 [Sclerotinia sclerotiorum 1980 UF-70]APA08349.1 hypothetical protein sscle_03g031190 [Sclerotinia sclerotiorum 1980 UF-70]EDN98421.1 hypothetical protein SS1G_13279 [Sclerotinia sclerotiorum 1980 UF-70]